MEDPTELTCYGAHVEAINRVELRPLVQGILIKQEKKDGAIVKKDEVLFRIDPTRYQAEVNAIKARIEKLNVSINNAQLLNNSL
jgi:multidrug resistance efflux pump